MNDDNQQHEGFENYETWCVARWFDNDEWRWQMVQRLLESDHTRLSLRVQGALWLDEELQTDGPGNAMVRDLLTAAVNRVNWKEIAEHWMAKV